MTKKFTVFRHVKTGKICKVLSEAQMQSSDWRRPTGPKGDPWKYFGEVDKQEVIVYIEVEDGDTVWVRPKYEFFDGRFEGVY